MVNVQTNRGKPAADSEHVYSSNLMSSELFSAHAPSSHAVSVQPTDNQVMFSQEDTKFWQWQQHYNQTQQQQQNIVQLSEEHAVLVPTRTEQLPRDVQQSMLTTIVSQHIPVNGSTAHRTEAVLPAPVCDIYQRLAEKQQQVISMSGDNDDVSHLLSGVQRGESTRVESLCYFIQELYTRTRYCSSRRGVCPMPH